MSDFAPAAAHGRYGRRRILATLPAAFPIAGSALAARNWARTAEGARWLGPLPAIVSVVVPEQGKQGHTVLVEVGVVGGAPPFAVSGRFGSADRIGVDGGAESTASGTPLRFFPAGEDGARYVALAGVPVDTAPGPWTMSASARSDAGEETGQAAQIEVVDGGFAVQRVVFAADLLSLLEPEVGLQEILTLATVMAAGAEHDTGPRWRGRFRLPVLGRVVTTHGARRDYLDPAGRVVARSQHSGVDLAVAGGTPIAAPAAGVVAFSGRWAIRGNVVVVDHGAGVHTVHAHASELLVSAGQEVASGQALARVGTTGLSTGPHLHWEVRVGGVAVDPLEWAQRDDLGLV